MRMQSQTLLGSVVLAAAMAISAPVHAQQQGMQGGQQGMQGGQQGGMQGGQQGMQGGQSGTQGGTGLGERNEMGMGTSEVRQTGDRGVNDLNAWDTDSSGTLDQNEWNTGFNQNSAWDTDGDGMVTDREYSQGMFNTYDRNRDTYLDENERQRFQDDAGEGGWMDM